MGIAMTKRTIWFLSLIAIVAWEPACSGRPESNRAKHIQNEIRPGLSSDLADTQLKKWGFKTILDPAKKSLYGDKRVANGVVIERTQIVVALNADNTVASVSVSTGLIGP
jgi:hypothetical protein